MLEPRDESLLTHPHVASAIPMALVSTAAVIAFISPVLPWLLLSSAAAAAAATAATVAAAAAAFSFAAVALLTSLAFGNGFALPFICPRRRAVA